MEIIGNVRKYFKHVRQYSDYTVRKSSEISYFQVIWFQVMWFWFLVFSAFLLGFEGLYTYFFYKSLEEIVTSLLSPASWQDNSRISFYAYLWSPYELSGISAAMTYIPSSIKVALALGHWQLLIGHLESFYETRCSQICLSDRQTIAFQCAKPNAQSSLYQLKRLSLIVRVNVVLNRTVVVDCDWRFDNLCGSHLQSQSDITSVDGIILWLLIWLVS